LESRDPVNQIGRLGYISGVIWLVLFSI